jgi:anaerobic C4-dicarboxylate transporter DcuA
LIQILLICVPATLLSVLIAAFAQLRVGKELKDDPDYQKLLASGELEPPAMRSAGDPAPLRKGAKASAFIFLTGVVVVVAAGIFPALRTVAGTGPEPVVMTMPISIAITMLAVAALILTVTKAPVGEVPKCKTCQSGITAIIGILGLAWLGDTFINANREVIIGGLGNMAKAAPWTFSIGLLFATFFKH